MPLLALGSTMLLADLGTNLVEECLGFRCTLLDSFSTLLPDLGGGDFSLANVSLEALYFFLGMGEEEKCQDSSKGVGSNPTQAAPLGT